MRFALLLVVLSAAVLVVPAASADIEILVSPPDGALEIEAGSSSSASSAVQVRTTGDNLCFTQGPVSVALLANATTPGIIATVVPETLQWEIPPGLHSSSADTDWTGEAQTATVTITVAADAPRNLTSHVVLFEVRYDGDPPSNCQGTFEPKLGSVEMTVNVRFPAGADPTTTPDASPDASPDANGTPGLGATGNGTAEDETRTESPALGIGLALVVLVATVALSYRRH